jgi:hypothetical protein
MKQEQKQPNSLELSPQIVTMMTTEHLALQSAQAQEISDINGRTSLFIGAVSSALIALAFIGQLSSLGTAFFVFSFVLFPALFFMGLVTFERVIQSTYVVIIYARGINRIRHLYVESAPQLQPYFVLSSHDDSQSVVSSVGIRITWRQIFLTAPGMIAVINSLLAGVFVGLLLSGLFNLSLLACTSAAVVTFLGSVGIHQRHHWKQFKRLDQSVPVLFSPDEEL